MSTMLTVFLLTIHATHRNLQNSSMQTSVYLHMLVQVDLACMSLHRTQSDHATRLLLLGLLSSLVCRFSGTS